MRRRRAWPTDLARSAAALGLALAVARQAQAADVSVQGAELNRFGRIALEFDRQTKVEARVSNGVLILSFSAAATVRGEQLARQMPAYVSVVRRDPDGTGLRLALTTPFRPNVLQAGEKVFVDLLPETWSGLPPALPPEVVEDLARRAREAEARVDAEVQRRQTTEPQPVAVKVAQLPSLTRVVFETPTVVPVDFKAEAGAAELRFTGHLKLDASDARAQLAESASRLEERVRDGLLTVRLAIPPGHTARGFREDQNFVVDIEKPEAAKPQPSAAAPAPLERAGDAKQAAMPVAPLSPRPSPDSANPAVAQPIRSVASAPDSPPPAAAPAGIVRPDVAVTAQGLRIAFPFAAPTAAALFERAGTVTAVFHTPEPIELTGLGSPAEPFAKLLDVVREGPFAIMRLALAKPQLARLSPQENGWIVSVGDTNTAASAPVAPVRAVDEAGRTVVGVPLADAFGVHWIDDASGERIAVVTAFGTPRGVVKPYGFTEFRLLPSAHGLAIAARADDVIVRSDIDRVTISRGAGLAVSLPDVAAPTPGRPLDPVIVRADWMRNQAGAVLPRWREHLHRIADASRSSRNRARLDLVHFLMANGLEAEALGVIALMRDEDPSLDQQPRLALLQGIMAVRMRRLADARRHLDAPALIEDAEGVLWRAVVDARSRRWPQALAGFRRSQAVLDAYPDDLQGFVRLRAVRAALGVRDFGYAERELTAIGQLTPGSVPGNEAALLRAQLDEALGRPEAALIAYQHLAETAERPVAAEATLLWVDLADREGAMPKNEVMARLETLSVVWRSNDVEIEAMGRLGRLYAEAGRWRDAFITARRANRSFPDHPVTRTLHDETARLFEDLFLAGKGESLDRLDALALFFDFKEFMPIGRRGDEIVRRLADRLVELDLLNEAAGLLEHQVEKRLTGAARATVAARLATIQLMNGRPAEALQAIQSTRLPELPATAKRSRLLLEARALSDLSRTDLALEVLDGEAGPEIERLRADIQWTGRRWREAGEAHERIVGTRWQGREPLSAQDRTDVMRAAIAYSLNEDTIALDRLRAKFAAKMADSADAQTFALLAAPGAAGTRAFREIARTVTSADTLTDFLREYRARYPDSAAAERPARTGLGADPEAATAASPDGARAQAGSEAAPKS